MDMPTGSAVLSRFIPWTTSTDEAGWDAVYAEHLPQVYNFFRYRVGKRADAEDLTSTAFEKAWSARGRYRRDLASFRTWLFAIARNVAIDHLRRARQHAPLEEAEVLAGPGSPENDAQHRSDCERLLRLLEPLPERERELLSLKYGAGLTNRAIARVTGLSESNVGTILHRTIADLRVRWDGKETSDG